MKITELPPLNQFSTLRLQCQRMFVHRNNQSAADIDCTITNLVVAPYKDSMVPGLLRTACLTQNATDMAEVSTNEKLVYCSASLQITGELMT